MATSFIYCAQCPRRLGTTRRALLIDLSQRVHEHRPHPGLWPETRADQVILEEYLYADALCSFCVEALEALDAA